jgi:putative tryptophan/tyrosine transport system substrate-binding protein
MRRREFMSLLGGSAIAFPLAAQAQRIASSPGVPRIGILYADGYKASSRPGLGEILIETLGGLGYVDGKTAKFIQRIPATQSDIRGRARELIDSNVDIIVAISVVGAHDVKELTRSIPIVVVLATDLVGTGLAESLAHPGGNVTGLSLMSDDLHAKRFSLLREAVPTLRRMTVLFDPGTPYRQRFIERFGGAYANAAKAVGIPLREIGVATSEAIDRVFAEMAGDGTEGVVVAPGPMMNRENAHIGAAALAHRIPTMGYQPGTIQDGLLMAYGQDYNEYARKAAVYVDKILKGAKPADLPIEQPTQFKLAINLKTAKALGLTIPASLIVSADEVIE